MAKAAVTLRYYSPPDLNAMVALDDICFAPAFRFPRSAMRRFAEAKKARVVIAEEGEQLAGFCILHVERAATRTGYILTLDVAPQHRRQGLATKLMHSAEQQACTDGCELLALHVWTGNSAALRFYERLGFKCVLTHPGFYSSGLDALELHKPLRDSWRGLPVNER